MQSDAQLQLLLGHVWNYVLFDRVEEFQCQERHFLSMSFVDSRQTTHNHVCITNCLHFVHINCRFISSLYAGTVLCVRARKLSPLCRHCNGQQMHRILCNRHNNTYINKQLWRVYEHRGKFRRTHKFYQSINQIKSNLYSAYVVNKLEWFQGRRITSTCTGWTFQNVYSTSSA